MSSRLLRKLQREKEKELGENENEILSDVDVETPVGGTRKKQLNINRYDLLNQQSHSESEVKEDDNETEANRSYEGEIHESVKKKRKKRKKKSGKQTSAHRSSEDNADVDEVERSLREVNRLLGESSHVTAASNQRSQEKSSHRKTALSVQHKHLNPNNELKRIFGSKVIQAEHKRKSRGGFRPHTKTTWMVSCKDNWPQVGKSGLSMNLLETKEGLHYFAYEHSQNYRQVENRFLLAVESINPDNIVSIINERPYHVNALIQMSDLCKLSEDLAMAAELIQRALYFQEFAFHPLFNIAQGHCRLDYRRQENRPLYITLFKHLSFLGGRACSRTALEFCKVLLSLDPQGDPLAVKLVMDFYALRAKEHQWLVDFVGEMDTSFHLMQLPNFAFSTAVAWFYLGEIGKADEALQDALLMFPIVLLPLLEKCSIQIDSRVSSHSFFASLNEKKAPSALISLVLLYVNRNYHLWKDVDLLPWLEKNVHQVLDKVDKMDPLVEEYKDKRLKRFSGPLPLSICRHLVLSDDAKGVPLMESSDPIMGFDPLPPKDSINSYLSLKRPTVVNNSSNPLLMFLGSLMPDFNPNQPVAEAEHQQDEAQALDRALVNNGDFRRSVVSLVDAMRDLLNNIRPEHQQQNDADDDADDSPDDEDDLT
ncbi:ribosome quality control complex subunit TCF25 [Euwallacea fornicatus]|uniref:ribosome quality control complex subunit TCF25 n=1 Tax=Euwallacea fornicatus TaxID=995702 RepID=UPI00338D800F